MKKLGLATALVLAMTGAHAYQVEVQGQSEFLDTKQNDKDFTGAAQGTYYFKNVDSSKGPLAEAAFLNQASNVSVAYSFAKESGDETITKKNESIGAKGEAYLPTPYLPVYTSASYSHSQTKTDGKKDNGDRFALEVGTMLTPNFLVAVGYTNIADQFALDANSVLARGIAKSVVEAKTIGEDQDAVTARTKYVGNIDGTNMAVGFEAGLVYGDDTAYELKTDLYLTPKLSVGASYAESSYANTPDSAWGANVNYFITPAVAVGASYVNANAVNADLDTQTIGLNAKFRF
ncbi:porin Omp33-36 [Acinetobacter sp. C26M]|uniref:porin Omp33-36 n=1 Tax=unclassified Acinetobacter TaxID=196816 RepID=UPI002037191E|nr:MULTISPECIES: porin Omp33-36 [unclassified Acinetobacter]USA48225.1 porin Omp33-36 [Acinetobacter sp. C26M]USA51707.1 porin Omp33-36 [Acinetobacter sp. C26G]